MSRSRICLKAEVSFAGFNLMLERGRQTKVSCRIDHHVQRL